MWPTLLILLPLVIAYSNNEYCSICGDHTMCRFQGVGSACGSGVTSGVSTAEAQQILQLHNKYRSLVATGNERRGAPGPQPSAADMQALIWDNDLAQVAQRWADQCTFQHDSCRNDPRFQVGQNIYWSSGSRDNQWDKAIQAWYDEVVSVNGQSVGNFQFDHSTGHYTQLVWAKSRFIGCGRTRYSGGYRNQADRPIAYVLSEMKNKTVSVQRKSVMRRYDNNPLGFFGGLTPNAAGAQQAITGFGSQPPVNNPLQPPQQTSSIPNPGMIAAGSNQEPFNPGNSQNHPGYGSNPAFGVGSSPDFNLSPQSKPEFGSNLGYGVNPGFGSNSGANSPYPVSSSPQLASNPSFYPTNPLENLVQNPFLGGNVNPGLITSAIGNLISPVVGQLLLTRDTPSHPVETKLKVYRLPTYAEMYLDNCAKYNKTLNRPIFQQNNRQQYGLPEPKPIAPPPTVEKPMYHMPHNGPMRPIQNSIRDHSNVDKDNWFNNWFKQEYQEWSPSYNSQNGAGSGGGSNQMLICNYGPAGNFLGSSMYIPGPPCSRCPSNTQCQNGLCT